VKDTIVVNDRWGAEDECQHGDIHTCTDRYNPGVIQEHKWENCMSLDKESFGYRKNMKLAEVISIQELIGTLVETVRLSI
jgi:alpha-L-fucosidase